VYGAPFKDEFHSRLRYNRRGLVGMANAGPDENQSQFFITLDRADELDKHNTLFGRISGNSVYNLLKVNHFEVDSADRPLEPVRLLRTEVLWNPFDDLLPRHDVVIPGRVPGSPSKSAGAGKSSVSAKPKKKRKKLPK
jgi:peptidyl-prolyl cis-trans isomerase SDCCAG10